MTALMTLTAGIATTDGFDFTESSMILLASGATLNVMRCLSEGLWCSSAEVSAAAGVPGNEVSSVRDRLFLGGILEHSGDRIRMDVADA